MSTRVDQHRADLCQRNELSSKGLLCFYSVRMPNGDLIEVGEGEAAKRYGELICAGINFLIDHNCGRLPESGYPPRLFECAGEKYVERKKPDCDDWRRAAEDAGKIPTSCDLEISLPFDQWLIARRALLTAVPENEDRFVRGARQSFSINRIKFVTPMAKGLIDDTWPISSVDDYVPMPVGSWPRATFSPEAIEASGGREPYQTAPEVVEPMVPRRASDERIQRARTFRIAIDGIVAVLANENIGVKHMKMVIRADKIGPLTSLLKLSMFKDVDLIGRGEQFKVPTTIYNGLRFEAGRTE